MYARCLIALVPWLTIDTPCIQETYARARIRPPGQARATKGYLVYNDTLRLVREKRNLAYNKNVNVIYDILSLRVFGMTAVFIQPLGQVHSSNQMHFAQNRALVRATKCIQK